MKKNCNYCERGCLISEEDSGFCGVYTLSGGKIREKYPDQYSSIGTSHIEGVPFFHVLPASRTLILGGAGCTMDCEYCSNAYVARTSPGESLRYCLPPEEAVKYALRTGCSSIAFAINEPAVAVPTIRKIAVTAKEYGLYTGILTNGFMPEETVKILRRDIAFVNVSIKAGTGDTYRSLTGVDGTEIVRRTVGLFRESVFTEVSTPIIQGRNDIELPIIAGFIEKIDPEIPWHLFRLLPEYRMADEMRPDIGEISRQLLELKKHVPFLYFGNFVGSEWVNTECPSCGRLLIERLNFGGCGAKCVQNLLPGSVCTGCGRTIPLFTGKWDGAA